MIEEAKIIVRIMAEKKDEEEDLIELRVTDEMDLQRFHKYLKIFEKKDLKRMPMRKAWDYAIDLREGFMLKKNKIYPLLRVEREEVQEFVKDQLRKGYCYDLKLKVLSSKTTLVLSNTRELNRVSSTK